MKIVLKLILGLFFLIVLLIGYLSVIGIETDRFNNQVSDKIKNIDEKIQLELKKIKLVLDPFKFRLNIKTVGPKIKIKENIIELENIKARISLKALVENNFLIENMEISTKSLEIKNLISFIRSLQNKPELFVLDKTFKKGFLIADIKLEFDTEGKIKDNYIINGLIKNTKFSFLKNYNFQKLDLIFEYKKDNLLLSDVSFSLNDLNFLSEYISLKKIKDNFLIKGNINHKLLNIDKDNYTLFIKPFLPKFEFKKLRLSSNNDFSFRISKNLKVNDFALESKLSVNEFIVLNSFNLKNFLPNIKESLSFLDHQLLIKYSKETLYIDGKGNILLQDKNDTFTYSLKEKDKIYNFKTSLKINDNPFKIDFLNFEKDEVLIELEGYKNNKNEINIKFFSIKEKKEKIRLNDLTFNNKFEIIKLNSFFLDYKDKKDKKNQLKLYPVKNKYILNGPSFNANSLINNLLFEDTNSNFFRINTKIEIDIDKIFLDNEYNLFDLEGDIVFKDKEISKANLNGNFSKDKKLKFTLNTKNKNKFTTLYVDKAEPILDRYKFIKGFKGGSLDFYSKKTGNESISTIKIYDFNLKELPVLTKILTLASLQGIADLMSGEGIGFDEFEMQFKNTKDLITIDEIYAIGPAISILMKGYVEKDKLVSLRGTLVPATTINKVIGSIPILGQILVGSKTGEGVFGVSFKIKGPQKNLETSVNPIKTLTPRFITRTLERIKGTN